VSGQEVVKQLTAKWFFIAFNQWWKVGLAGSCGPHELDGQVGRDGGAWLKEEWPGLGHEGELGQPE
jgi:hypothetical protein